MRGGPVSRPILSKAERPKKGEIGLDGVVLRLTPITTGTVSLRRLARAYARIGVTGNGFALLACAFLRTRPSPRGRPGRVA
ncbi:hypothetical protein Sros01_77140 [Streptomyces roseochromogenus]|nr:hypothetical protein Sros01_77140 [Streptomyces roseochromogenus]